jgi:hypothetical protein
LEVERDDRQAVQRNTVLRLSFDGENSREQCDDQKETDGDRYLPPNQSPLPLRAEPSHTGVVANKVNTNILSAGDPKRRFNTEQEQTHEK